MRELPVGTQTQLVAGRTGTAASAGTAETVDRAAIAANPYGHADPTCSHIVSFHGSVAVRQNRSLANVSEPMHELPAYRRYRACAALPRRHERTRRGRDTRLHNGNGRQPGLTNKMVATFYVNDARTVYWATPNRILVVDHGGVRVVTPKGEDVSFVSWPREFADNELPDFTLAIA